MPVIGYRGDGASRKDNHSIESNVVASYILVDRRKQKNIKNVIFDSQESRQDRSQGLKKDKY